MRVYALRRDFKEFPYWKKGSLFGFEIDTGVVWGMEDKETTKSYPLRTSLAGYLNLLLSEKGMFRRVL